MAKELGEPLRPHLRNRNRDAAFLWRHETVCCLSQLSTYETKTICCEIVDCRSKLPGVYRFANKTPVYFPPGVFGEAPGVNETAERFSELLKSLHEPSLWELSQKDNKTEVYRFFMLRFADNPVTVRLAVNNGRTYSRIGRGTWGSKPQGGRTYFIVLGRKDAVQGFANDMNQADFWDATTTPCADDSVHWILEGVKAGKYHVVDRCSPRITDPFNTIGDLALKLSGLFPQS